MNNGNRMEKTHPLEIRKKSTVERSSCQFSLAEVYEKPT